MKNLVEGIANDVGILLSGKAPTVLSISLLVVVSDAHSSAIRSSVVSIFSILSSMSLIKLDQEFSNRFAGQKLIVSATLVRELLVDDMVDLISAIKFFSTLYCSGDRPNAYTERAEFCQFAICSLEYLKIPDMF